LLLVSGSPVAAGATSSAKVARPALAGREVFKIVGTVPGPRHARVTATGIFRASGYFVRSTSTIVFPKGRIKVVRRVRATTYSPPDLATCQFMIRQIGTFRVVRATGWYRGLRDAGQFSTRIWGRLRKTGPDQCGSQIVAYRSTTYEVGRASR